MVQYSLGARVRAADLRDALPVYGVLNSDAAVSLADFLIDSAGLYVPMETNAQYALDGYIGFQSNATARLRAGFTAPPGCTGTWGLAGPSGNNTTFNSYAAISYDSGVSAENYAFGPGSSTLMALQPHGYIETDGAAGVLRLRFGQTTADASTTTIKAGSWLRLTRLDS